MQLESIRQEIDAVDSQLVDLLEKRMELVSQVVAYKKVHKQAVLDTKREEMIFKKVKKQVQDKRYEDTIVKTFASILKASRAYQDGCL